MSLLPREHPVHKGLIFLSVLIPTTLAFLTSNSTVVLQSIITAALAINGSLSSWMTIIYLLGPNTLVPVANRIADRFGYKKIFCLGVAFFTIGTGGVGLSREFLSLAASRLLEGVGAVLIFPLSLALLVKEFSKEKLGIDINLYLALSLTIGCGFGPIFSGYCAMHFVWNTAFLSLLPFCLLTFVLGCICHEETEKIYRGAFDIRGFFLFTCSISLILVALSEGNLPSTAEGWRSPYILSCLSCFCF